MGRGVKTRWVVPGAREFGLPPSLSSRQLIHISLHPCLVFIGPVSTSLQLGFAVGRWSGWWVAGGSGLARARLQLERGARGIRIVHAGCNVRIDEVLQVILPKRAGHSQSGTGKT